MTIWTPITEPYWLKNKKSPEGGFFGMIHTYMFSSLDQLSHATIVLGNRKKNLEQVKDFLQSQNIAVQGNPDVFIFEDEQLLVDNARMITEMLVSKKLSSQRFLIISCGRMAEDVQNTLLKTLEEPHRDTFIMLLLPRIEQVLPTIRSRVQVIKGSEESEVSRLSATEFISLSMANRFTLIESLVKNKKEEDNLSKTEIIACIEQLEKILWEKNIRDEILFKDIRQIRDYVGIRGSSHRILLDYLAMITPVLK